MPRHYVGIALLLAAGLTVAALARAADRQAVYPIAVLTKQLAYHPRAWVGRTVLVRAVVQGIINHTWRKGCEQSPLCAMVQAQWNLDDPDGTDLTASLPLQWGAPDPLRALLRQAPLIGHLAPPPQVARPETAATYRIQIRAVRHGIHDAGYAAVLLDVAP